MARVLDGVSGAAVSGSASERRVEASNPQPYRVGFEQVMSLGAAPQLQDISSIYEAARNGTLLIEGAEIDTTWKSCICIKAYTKYS